MGLLNQQWYNMQSVRAYPLDDIATCIDDNGLELADDIIVDCNIRFPGAQTLRAMLTAVTVTPTLVTALVSDASGNLLASVNILQPVASGQIVAVTPIANGVGGWLVFGPGVETTQTYRFSSSSQSLLLARCACAYAMPNVLSISKADQTALLTGVVNLKAGTDIEIDAETVLVDEKLHTVLAIGLTASNLQNTLKQYNSVCEPRPERGNCGKLGVQSINSVTPDCAGNINIIFEGLVVGPYGSPAIPSSRAAGGVTLDYAKGLAALCNAAATQISPTHTDYCGSSLYLPDMTVAVSSVHVMAVPPEAGCQSLPFCTLFNDGDFTNFLIKTGNFGTASPPTAPHLACHDVTPPSNTIVFAAVANYARNVAVFNSCVTSGTTVTATAELYLPSSTAAANAQVIVAWQLNGSLETYFTATVDMVAKTLRIDHYQGIGFTTLQSTAVLPLQYNTWYTLSASLTAGIGDGTFTATLSTVYASSFPTTTLILTSNQFSAQARQGLCGVGSLNSICYFDGFTLRIT